MGKLEDDEVGVHFFTAKGTKNTKIHRVNLVIDA